MPRNPAPSKARRAGAFGLLVAALMSAVLALPVCQAGECTHPAEYYVQNLETLGKAGPPFREWEPFACLACQAKSWSRWAGPIAAARFEACRKYSLRNRIADACVPFLNAPPARPGEWFEPRLFAAELLAYYGVGSVGGHDIFAILRSDADPRRRLAATRLMALACLRDPRTSAFLAAEYDSLLSRQKGSATPEISDILNCLYHLPDSNAVVLAAHIAVTQSAPDIRERAARVLDR